jgi:signal recognition particle subunit SRP68
LREQDPQAQIFPKGCPWKRQGVQKTASNYTRDRELWPVSIQLQPTSRISSNSRRFSLQLLLFEAERAWAYSHELTAQSLDPAKTDKRSALRHSATSRFRRAINWSTQLLSLVQSLYASKRLSAENLLEVTTYTLILNGRFLRSREEQLQDALPQLSVARYLLDSLCAQATSSRDQALATLLIDEIGPEIRYCAHQLGNKMAYDVDGIVRELAAIHKDRLVEGCGNILAALKEEAASGAQGSLKQNLNTLIWEGKPVPVRNPELVDALLKVQEAEAKLAAAKKSSGSDKVQSGTNITKRRVGAYDAILSALSDSEEVARKQVETQQVSVDTPSLFMRCSYILCLSAEWINCRAQRWRPRC